MTRKFASSMALFFMFSYAVTALAAQELVHLENKVSLSSMGGEFVEFKDGVVSCVLFIGGFGGRFGLDCKGDISKIDLDRLGEKVFSIDSGRHLLGSTLYFNVTRKSVGDRLCYVTDGAKFGGDMSCLMK